MNASDITRQVYAKATLAGFNSLLVKTGQPTATYTDSNCAGFFDASSCSFQPNPRSNAPSLIKYPSYAYRQLVQEGVLDNNIITSNVVTMTTQKPVVCANIIYTVPLS
jgi:hypothetical protein